MGIRGLPLRHGCDHVRGPNLLPMLLQKPLQQMAFLAGRPKGGCQHQGGHGWGYDGGAVLRDGPPQSDVHGVDVAGSNGCLEGTCCFLHACNTTSRQKLQDGCSWASLLPILHAMQPLVQGCNMAVHGQAWCRLYYTRGGNDKERCCMGLPVFGGLHIVSEPLT